MKKLPIGISTLKKIIDGDFVYVDKTSFAYDLIANGGGYYFLSHPRHFGKSLFLDTLKEIFQGNKELFKNLYIHKKYDFNPHPVLTISFGSGDFKSVESLQNRILEILNRNKRDLELDFEELKTFYSIIKDSDKYLKFVFLTGVSKFSKVSLFSGLNNLNDITLDESYSTICGYTQRELEIHFKNH